MINILAFGIAKEIVGGSKVEMEVKDSISAAELKNVLAVKFPRLLKLKSFLLAVNNSYASDVDVIRVSDEIAIIPPVSGG